MRNRSIIAILLACITAVPALAEDGPPWQVRPYLSTYTDDSARSATETWTWNYSALRHHIVCPYCGYSTTVEDPTPDLDYTCPNPFDIAGHPATQLTEANPLQRVLGHLEVGAEDIDGDEAAPLVGRPFHPGGIAAPVWNDTPSPWEDPVALEDQASWVTLRADNLDATDGGGPLVQDGDGLRFLLLEPGAVRPQASFQYVDPTDVVTAAATFYATGAGDAGTSGAGPANYIISINPNRVSDGDVFYIRHHERRETWFMGFLGRTAEVDCQVYSTLYGNDFDTAGEIDDALLELAPYDTQQGCQIVTDSGALRVTLPRRFSTVAVLENTWVLKIVINSNARLMPGPEEVNWDLVDGVDLYTEPAEVEPDLLTNINADLSQKKAAYVAYASGNDPALATADDNDGIAYDVEEKDLHGDGFISSEIWPYRMQPEAAGRGRAMLQWSELIPSAALQQDNPAFLAQMVYYRDGAEWNYLADIDGFETRLVTNGDVANQTAISSTTTNYTYIDSYFMCSRVDVDHDAAYPFYLADDNWMDSLGNDKGVVVGDLEPATGGHARIVLGELQDAPSDAWGGEYKPGTRTPARVFSLANRMEVRPLVCPLDDDGCGARYRLDEPFADGNDGQLAPGDDCPACGVELILERGEAEVRYDSQDVMAANAGAQRMTATAFRFEPNALVPMGAVDFEQEVFADIPAYQPPSVPAGATPFANDIANDFGYRGTMVAFNRPEDDGDAQTANTNWDAYYLSPEDGDKLASVDAATAADAEWVCSVCHTRLNRSYTDCTCCGHTFAAADDLPNPYVMHDALTAEEYDPFGLQLSVLRQAGLAADQRVVDLGWVAPGTPQDAPNTVNGSTDVVAGSAAVPTDVSNRGDLPVRNEGNIIVDTEMRSGPLLQTGVDQAVRSESRWAQSVPITLGTLFRYRPGPNEFDSADWMLDSPDATGAAGASATAMLQVGVRAIAGDPYGGTVKPVPLGQPVGNYASEVLVFIDLNGDGDLDFYDVQTGATNRPSTEFDPGIDEPFEPVAPFATRARVTEARLPQDDFYSQDVTPTLLYQENQATPDQSRMQVLWVGQRAAPAAAGADAPAGVSPANVPAPIAPTNILYSNAQVNAGAAAAADPVYRGWLWAPAGTEPADADALSVSATANESNSSPTAYVDGANGNRWVMWHRSQASAAGISSQLRFDTSSTADWDGSDPTEFIFGSAGAHSGLTAFVRPGAANAHWLLWHGGPVGRENLRYRWEWDPTSGTVPGDARLMVSNTSTGLRFDYFDVGGQRYRKPALDPFTYVKEASAFGTTDGAGDFQLDVLFTGHIRSLGNSDICWSRFSFGNPADADFPYNSAQDNFGKVPFPRVAGQTYGAAPYATTDARGMSAVIDAAGDVRGYVGEQLQSSPRREAFQAHDIDWLVTYDYETDPDWQTWLTDAAPKPTTADYDDPMLYVGVVTDDGTGAAQSLYAVEWSEGAYNAATGLYQVLPRLIGLDVLSGSLAELPDPADPANDPALPHPNDDSATDAIYWRAIGGVNAKALLAPRARQEAMDGSAPEGLPAVMLTINPASGMVQWSSSLFNPDNPFDSQAVFNEQNTPNIVDVVMYADYTPFTRRATTDMADDDSPSAFWNAGDSGRLTVFWRRSYADTDTPHFGRPSFLYKTYTRAIQVGRPPIAGMGSVIDRTVHPTGAAPDVTYNVLSPANGVIEIGTSPATSLSRIGHRIAVTYTDGAGVSRTEQHRVIGWSLETPVPINAVTSEGPLRVIPEVYDVDPGSGDVFTTVRYWLAWSSSRGVYDMRGAAADGQRVHQSPDVYLAVVAPEHSSLIADLQVPRLEP